MNSYDPDPFEPTLLARRFPIENQDESPRGKSRLNSPLRPILLRTIAILVALALILPATAFVAGRYWTRHALRASLPQIDGTLSIPGLSAPVTVQRDAHGVPHIHAATLDDLIVAQGFVTAQDRLWQMDILRRHAAGELAEVLGPSLVPHDRAQRILQVRAAADRAIATLPPDQLHWLQLYARGVNDSIEVQRPHLPIEFRILRYQPSQWTPRDSILVGLAMFQDLTNSFPQKLDREALSAKLPPELLGDLYPVGSWRDHPPTQPVLDLTNPPADFNEIPLDESQSKLNIPTTKPATKTGAPYLAVSSPDVGSSKRTTSTGDLLALQKILAASHCEGCTAGSNNWVVSGTRTASGKPLLSNDMHLNHSVPGVWYEADLQSASGSFHVAGVTLPGYPFVIVGHNDHIAWGFTNLGADVQDIYIEHTRGTGSAAEYESSDSNWHPILHQREVIHVLHHSDVILDVAATQHGGVATPLISNLFPRETRSLSLRWTIYDPSNITPSFLSIDSAIDWPSFTAAFSTFGGPAQNVVYADDHGNIGYHAAGRIPIRGSLTQPTALSPVPTDALDPTHEWAGYIPFDQLPQSFDPPGGVLATANARVTADGYPFPITLNWAAPYRNERIWKVLSSRDHLTPADMLALQTDVYSDLDHVIAQRLAYAIDHSQTKDKRIRQAADILRKWNGNVDVTAAAPAIVDATRAALWPLLLNPHLGPHPGGSAALYTWSEKPYAEEQLIMHTPARWLPPTYANWDELLTAAVAQGLIESHAPFNLTKWQYGQSHVVNIEHPIFAQSRLLQRLVGIPTGTKPQPQSGDTTTIKQVGRSFGPSERFTADLSNFDDSTLNIVLGQSGNLTSPWFMDQWPAWYKGTTFNLPFSKIATDAAATHTLTLTPQ
ncbi:penicillin acylase family protein [Edaphobacter sp. DSM 109919]|uniref:Penicillin acylase family protein n=1 Tax=Edaphobacter paludis TaxID=3035702 RepID=A0AAU7D1L5_9BACT